MEGITQSDEAIWTALTHRDRFASLKDRSAHFGQAEAGLNSSDVT